MNPVNNIIQYNDPIFSDEYPLFNDESLPLQAALLRAVKMPMMHQVTTILPLFIVNLILNLTPWNFW